MSKIPNTQLNCWNSIKGNLSASRLNVLEAISKRKNGVSLHHLVHILNKPVNRISGRITELKRIGLIEDSGQRSINPESGKPAIVWKLSSKAINLGNEEI